MKLNHTCPSEHFFLKNSALNSIKSKRVSSKIHTLLHYLFAFKKLAHLDNALQRYWGSKTVQNW